MNQAMQAVGKPRMVEPAPVMTTLLEVVTTVAEYAGSDREVIAVIDHLFASGRMKLVGQFTEQDFGLN